MKRIEILYGGEMYSVADRDYAELQAEIATALGDGPGWLRVNHGSGALAPADLLLTTGVSIALLSSEDQPGAVGGAA